MTPSTVNPTTIAVLGDGNSSFATIAALTLHGHTVRLLESLDMADSIAPIQQEHRITLEAPSR